MILALKTASNVTELRLFGPEDGQLIAEETWDSGRELADGLLDHLQQLLGKHDATFADLSGLIIFSGPGSFTSLRIGHTVLNALADSLNIPVVGAQGDDWTQSGLAELPAAHLGRPALPHYGGDANVTLPKP